MKLETLNAFDEFLIEMKRIVRMTCRDNPAAIAGADIVINRLQDALDNEPVTKEDKP